ncbi:phage major capsid protein, partial [Bacillus cereus group sp. N6]|nr:phage major capsid protein [Bacillus cereus group sp. N6]
PSESVFVPQGKVMFFVKGEYIAAMGGTEPIKKFEETLALEDATLYIAKQYATGKPKDKYTSQVYTLKLEEVTPPTQG